MGLDLSLYTCTHLVKKEDALVKDDTVEAYVVYGMNVFEYEHTEKQLILENQTDETAVHQTQGDSRKMRKKISLVSSDKTNEIHFHLFVSTKFLMFTFTIRNHRSPFWSVQYTKEC